MKLRRFRSRKLLTTLAVAGVAVTIAVFAAARWANTPVTTTIRPVATTPVAQPVVADQPIKTAYFTTLVPATWHIANRTTDSSTKVQILAYASHDSDAQVGITSDVLPADGLAAVGDYHLRVSDSLHYPSFSDIHIPQTAKVFRSSSDPTQLTMFITASGRYASITIGSEPILTDSLQLLDKITTNWVWN